MYKVISKCPICNNRLKVMKLQCDKCNTSIENEFKLSKFDYLDNDDLIFVETFIKCRGSIKEVEKEMQISYPTVRAKLDDIINKLGYKVKEQPKTKKSNEIIEALEKGEITADEAIKKLKE